MSDGGKGFGPKGSDAGSKGKGMMKGWLMEMMAAWKGKSKGSGGFDGSPPVAEAPIVDPKGMPKGPASVKGEGLPTAQHAKGKSKGPDDLDGLPTAPEAPKDPKGQSKGSASVKGEGLPTKGKGGVPVVEPYKFVVPMPPPQEGTKGTTQQEIEIGWIIKFFEDMNQKKAQTYIKDAKKHPLLQRYVAEDLELGPTLKIAKRDYDYVFGEHDACEELAGLQIFIRKVLREEHPRVYPWTPAPTATPPAPVPAASLPADGKAESEVGATEVENPDDSLEPFILL